jgi:hypothetical protein
MGLDTDGNLYGYQESLDNLKKGVAALRGDTQNGVNLWITSILKLLRLKHEFGLSIPEKDYGLIRRILAAKSRNAQNPPEDIDREITKVIIHARSPKAAILELQDLGFSVNENVAAAVLDRLEDADYHVRRLVAEVLTDMGLGTHWRGIREILSEGVWEKDGNLYYESELPLFHSMEFSTFYGPKDWEALGYRYLGIKNFDRSSSPLRDPGQTAAGEEEVGGIDMNTIDLDRRGAGVDIQFDPAKLREMMNTSIDGFAPVIIDLIPLPSVLPILGLEPQKKDEEGFELLSQK